ncbi:MAG: hypothetical protein PHO53_05515 [Actinomycetota bacterium]|nr:hypothetical protein [Actinomycetota bacterium]
MGFSIEICVKKPHAVEPSARYQLEDVADVAVATELGRHAGTVAMAAINANDESARITDAVKDNHFIIKRIPKSIRTVQLF